MTSARLPRQLVRLTRGQQVLVLLVAGVLPAFAATAVVVGAHRREQVTLAREWRERSDDALRSGDAGAAILALRNALRFGREDRDLRLRLAQTLASAGRLPEARAYLLGLWADQPGNGPVNLELARLSAAQHDLDEARRFYTNAIQGAWAERAPEQRRSARLELADLLVARGANELAQAELIALAADPAPDSRTQVRVAALLARAGAPRRALAVFEQVLTRQPRLIDARVGAGTSAFAVGDYARAVRHLSAAAREGAGQDAADLLATAEAVLALDPHRRGLTLRDRAARIRRVLRVAAARLDTCAGDGAAVEPYRAELAERLKAITPRALAERPALLDDAVLTASRAEAAGASCRPPTAEDRAVRLLATPPEGGGS